MSETASEQQCKGCGKEKPLDAFGRDKRNLNGRRGVCKTCYSPAEVARVRRWKRENPEIHREGSTRRRMVSSYGITFDQAQRLLAAQGGRCAICRVPIAYGGAGGAHTDHCHQSNVVRGVLCNGCNKGLGMFRDDPAVLRAAIRYLARASKMINER